MRKNFDASKSNRFRRWKVRCQERASVRGSVYRCFCEGKEIPDDLQARARELDIFAGRPAMSDEQAIQHILASSSLSRKEQRKDRLLFQAFFIVGSRRFWNIFRNFRIGRELLTTGVNSQREIPGILYHQTARRCGKGYAASCPQVSCRI